MGSKYRVIDEGLCGRTVNYDDLSVPGVNRNGLNIFKTLLITHSEVDLCIIMLGTNDQKHRFFQSGDLIAEGLKELVLISREDYGYGHPPKAILICPPSLTKQTLVADGQFINGPRKSKELRDALTAIEHKIPATVLYADDYIKNDSSDGIHLSSRDNILLAHAVIRHIKTMI
jgi:lysophospholipase L1-like esterase